MNPAIAQQQNEAYLRLHDEYTERAHRRDRAGQMNLVMCAAQPDTATCAHAAVVVIQPAVAEIVSNGWLLAAVRNVGKEHTDQWPAETIWLVKGQAFLTRDGEYVNLHLVGRKDELPIFIFDQLTGWRELAGLDAKYAEWSNGR